MIKQPKRYLLLVVLTAILGICFGCTNVTENPPSYVISTPRIPQNALIDTTPTTAASTPLSVATPVTQSEITTDTSSITKPVIPPIQLSKLTPQQILNSSFFKSESLSNASQPTRGGNLKIASSFDIPTLDPRQIATGGTMVLASFVYEGFFRYDQSSERHPLSPAILPSMAYQWDFSKEGTELVIKLNSGIHWGNMENALDLGPEITASDYLYTINAYRDNSSLYKFYESLESVETQGRYELKLTFSRPSFWIIPFFASSLGIQFNPFLADADKLDHVMIGPGPFILDSYATKSQATLTRNPHYYRKDYNARSLPYLGSIQFIYAADRDTHLALLKTAGVHLTEMALTPQEIDTELSSDPNLTVSLEIPSGIQNSIALQLDNLTWSTKEARRALSLVTDGKGISDTIFGKFGMPSDKFEWWYWNETLPSWEDDLHKLYGDYHNHTDVEKAQSLWANEGLGDITIKVDYYPHSEAYTEILSALQQDWKQLGITVQLSSLSYQKYRNTLRQQTAIDAILATQTTAADIRSAAYDRIHSAGSGNREGINDTLVDTLVSQLAKQPLGTIDRSQLERLRQHLNDQVYWIALPSVAFMSGTIFHTNLHGIPSGNHSSFRAFYHGKVLAEAWID